MPAIPMTHTRSRHRSTELLSAGRHGPGHKQDVPGASPQHLNHVPSGAAEVRFKLLHDLAVATYWPIEALQIAVDDENEVR
jgi:hypothetical protein